MASEVLTKASQRREPREPLVARVMTFQLCPATAKFVQLRCSSLVEEDAPRLRWGLGQIGWEEWTISGLPDDPAAI